MTILKNIIYITFGTEDIAVAVVTPGRGGGTVSTATGATTAAGGRTAPAGGAGDIVSEPGAGGNTTLGAFGVGRAAAGDDIDEVVPDCTVLVSLGTSIPLFND